MIRETIKTECCEQTYWRCTSLRVVRLREGEGEGERAFLLCRVPCGTSMPPQTLTGSGCS